MRLILSILLNLIFLTSYSQIRIPFNSGGQKIKYNDITPKLRYNQGQIIDPPDVTRVSGTFPYSNEYAYHNASSAWGGLNYFFNGVTTNVSPGTTFGTNWVLVDSSEFNFLFPIQSQMRLKTVRIFDANGSEPDPTKYTKFWAVLPNYSKVLIGTHDFDPFNQWVNLSLPDSLDVIGVVMQVYRPSGTVILPTEIQFLGSWVPYTQPAYTIEKTTFASHVGQNSYWYNYQFPSTVSTKAVDTARATVSTDVQGTTRLYTDMRNWVAVDPTLNNGYFFTPEYSHLSGGANYDTILHFLKSKGVNVILDVKDISDHLRDSYPFSPRTDFIPIRYEEGNWPQQLADPASYKELAMLHTQLTMRYGRNASVNPALSRVYGGTVTPWNPSLSVNTTKFGLDLVHTIEIGNEHNKFWAVPARSCYLAPEENAAMLSACYDGHKGALGDSIGIKTIDPTMRVASMGMVGANPGYVLGMVNWARKYRGLRPDGSVDVPWDDIKIHQYFSDAGAEQTSNRTRGAAPETINLDSVIGNMSRSTYPHFLGVNEQFPLMVGESGYDVANTIQQARQMLWVGKGRVQTQADWLVRSMLIFMKLGINSTQFYQLADDGNATYLDKPNGILDTINLQTNYYSSGIILRQENTNVPTKRPAGLAFQQILDRWRNWSFDTVISAPSVLGRTDSLDVNFNGDTAFVYQIRRGDSTARVIWLGTESGLSDTYTYESDSTHVEVWTYSYTSPVPILDTIPVVGGGAVLSISERPIWVREINVAGMGLRINYSSSPGTLTYAKLPYNREVAFSLEWDDNSYSAIRDGAQWMDNLYFSDGTGGMVRYSAGLAINGRRAFNNNEIGLANEPGRVQYDSMWMLVRKGWEIQNHGWYHDPTGNFNYTNMIPGANDSLRMQGNIKRLNDSVFVRIGYRVNGVSAPSNHAYSGAAAGALGMMYVTGQSSSVFLPYKWLPRLNVSPFFEPRPAHIEWVDTAFGAFNRYFTDGWAGSYNSYRDSVNNVLATATPTAHRFMMIGTHGVAEADTGVFRQFVQHIHSQSNNRAFVGTKRQIMEHLKMPGWLEKEESIEGNTLVVTLHTEDIPDIVQYRKVTLLASNPANITSITYNGVSIPFNATTGQFNLDFGNPSWWVAEGTGMGPGEEEGGGGGTVLSGYGPGTDTGIGVSPSVRPPLVKYTVNVSTRVKGFMEWKPNDYATKGGKRYPLMIMMHGIGETGDGSSAQLEEMKINPPFKYIDEGSMPTYFLNGGDTTKFIWVAPQFNGGFATAEDVNNIINYMYTNYRVDTSRVYLTGLSFGGGMCWEYARSRVDWASRVTAIMPVGGSRGNSAPNQAAGDTMAAADIAMWVYHHSGDPVAVIGNPTGFVNAFNASAISHTRTPLFTVITSSSHGGWFQFYDPTYRPSASGNLNFAEWALQYTK